MSLKELLNQHPDLQNASGVMPGTYSIKIDPTAAPVVHGPRRQPAALLPKIVSKLKEMEKEGHLAKVTQPTDWVNSMVVSSRGDKIRICLDPGDLNKAVKRNIIQYLQLKKFQPKHLMPKCSQSLTQRVGISK